MAPLHEKEVDDAQRAGEAAFTKLSAGHRVAHLDVIPT